MTQHMSKFFQKDSLGSLGVLCGLHTAVLPSVMTSVIAMDAYINAPYTYRCGVDICLHDVSPIRTWTPQGQDYTLFIFVFPGLENKYLWKEGREERRKVGKEE